MTIEKKLISQKKPFYPISKKLESFLKLHDRWINDVISYDDLLRYTDSINIYDKNDRDTLWVRLSVFEKNDKTQFVGVAGFEPATSASQTRRDNRATLHPEK